MSHINSYDEGSKYGQLAHKLLEIASISGRKVVLRQNGQLSESTEIVHEMGTTPVIFGESASEIMTTMTGKIPKEMFYLEDTSITTNPVTHKFQTHSAFEDMIAMTTQKYQVKNESSKHSTVLIALLTALLVIMFLCCITACFVAKSKKKNSFLGNSGSDCEAGCTGLNQPLLDKISTSTNKTRISSSRD